MEILAGAEPNAARCARKISSALSEYTRKTGWRIFGIELNEGELSVLRLAFNDKSEGALVVGDAAIKASKRDTGVK